MIKGKLGSLKVGDSLPVRIVGVVNLSLASFYKGSIALSVSDVEKKIVEMIEEGVSLVEHEIGFSNIQIIKEFASDLPKIGGDKQGLSKVVFNLLSNARDAMPEGGILKITTRASDNCDPGSGGPDLIKISFEDTGCGISAEHLDKIFDPFFTTKETGSGVGLGLSLTYGIIQEHGGSISVEAKVKEGSKFTISLPALVKTP